MEERPLHPVHSSKCIKLIKKKDFFFLSALFLQRKDYQAEATWIKTKLISSFICIYIYRSQERGLEFKFILNKFPPENFIIGSFSYWYKLSFLRVCMSLLMGHAAADAKSLQLCLTLCNPIDGSLPGSSVPGILQARTLEWVAISFSNAWKWKVKVKSLSRVRLFVTPWATDYQAPPSMGFSRHEYWSGVPVPSLFNGP